MSNRDRVLNNIAYEIEEYKEEEDKKTKESNSSEKEKKRSTHLEGKEEHQSQTQGILQRILERLERSETQQNKTKKKIWRDQPNRS